MNILIRDTYIWVGFQSQCLFSLIPFFSLKERQIHFSRIHFRPSQPSENQGENCLRSEDDLIPRQLDWAQLRRDWLVIKRAPFWILSLLECDAHLHKFIILYWFFWMFFRKGVVRGCIIDDDTNCVSFSHSCVNKGQVFLSLLCEMPQESLFSRCWSDYVSTSVWLFRNAAALHQESQCKVSMLLLVIWRATGSAIVLVWQVTLVRFRTSII